MPLLCRRSTFWLDFLSASRVDAFVHSAAVDHKHIPITYHIPGWVATLALIVMNITSRQELAEPEEMYVDDNFTVGFHFCCYTGTVAM